MSGHDNGKGFHRVSVIFEGADIGCRDSQKDCHRVSRYSGGYRDSQYDCHRVMRDSGGLSRGGGVTRPSGGLGRWAAGGYHRACWRSRGLAGGVRTGRGTVRAIFVE